MVSQVSDSSFHPEANSNEDNCLADQVLSKLQDESLTSAFKLLKSSVQNVYSGRDEDRDGVLDLRPEREDVPMNSKEKQEFWTSLTKELEEKRPGVLKSLSAVWLKDFKATELEGRTFEADFVRQVAANSSLMNKTFAGEALKDLNNIKNLNRVDNIIDDVELDTNILRQKQIPRDQFIQNVIEKARTDSETNPAQAAAEMKQALKTRSETETQAEKLETAAALNNALVEHPDLAAKLAESSKPKIIPREVFAASVISQALKDVETNPVTAVDAIYAALKKRGDETSQDERYASFTAIAKELQEHPGLAEKLSMGYMHRNFKNIDTTYGDHNQDYRISKEEMDDFKTDQVGKVFMDYVRANFDDIASTSIKNVYRNPDFLTQDEVANHINRLKRKK